MVQFLSSGRMGRNGPRGRRGEGVADPRASVSPGASGRVDWNRGSTKDYEPQKLLRGARPGCQSK